MKYQKANTSVPVPRSNQSRGTGPAGALCAPLTWLIPLILCYPHGFLIHLRLQSHIWPSPSAVLGGSVGTVLLLWPCVVCASSSHMCPAAVHSLQLLRNPQWKALPQFPCLLCAHGQFQAGASVFGNVPPVHMCDHLSEDCTQGGCQVTGLAAWGLSNDAKLLSNMVLLLTLLRRVWNSPSLPSSPELGTLIFTFSPIR